MTVVTVERPHGYARYKMDGCRCYTCCFSVSQYETNRKQQIAAGTWRSDTEPIRVHLRSLMAAGMGWKRIARKAGVGPGTVSRILYGRNGNPPPATVRYDIGQKLLAVELDLDPQAAIEATGTVRRIQALVAIGHTQTAIAAEIGWTLQNLNKLVRAAAIPYAARVEVRTAKTVAALYDRWSMTVPTGWIADRARRQAAAHGWPPPLAWDDDQLDDPTATPDTSWKAAA